MSDTPKVVRNTQGGTHEAAFGSDYKNLTKGGKSGKGATGSKSTGKSGKPAGGKK